MDRFSDSRIRSEKQQQDALELYKLVRDMELEQREEVVVGVEVTKKSD